LAAEAASAPTAPAGAVVAAVAGLAAAWVAAGSAGLLAHSLRHALTWVLLGSAIVAGWRGRGGSPIGILTLLAAAGAAVVITSSSLVAVNVMAVALVLAILCWGQSGPGRSVLLATSLAVVVLGIYQFARTSIPSLWLFADFTGWVIGWLAGRIARQPLRVGATFAGMDFLVTMAALYVGWLVWTPPPRRARAIYGAIAILVGHFVYLIVLAFAPALLEALPEPPVRPAEPLAAPIPMPKPWYLPVFWWWSVVLRKWVPWHLPLLACVVHIVIASAMFRWSAWPAVAPETPGAPAGLSWRRRLVMLTAGGIAAAAVPVVTALSWGKATLEGRKIVFYEKGFLNWERPTHGEYGSVSTGMYGMLPIFVESLGARCVVSPELSERDLQDADVVVLLYPDQPWAEGQLERLRNVARRGGSLLVVGEHTILESDGGNRFNDVLAPTGMRVRFDSAMFAVGGWLQSYEALAHPTTAGIPDDSNQFGVVIGASVAVRWPARPVVAGKWGWSDPGDPGSDAAMMGNDLYDPGEKLGDLVLVAEQPFGRGRIVAFGDTSGFSNAINIGSHVFTSRLLAYLAGGPSSPGAMWRQVLGLLVGLGLVVLLGWRPDEWRTAAIAIAMAVSLVVCTRVSHRACEVYPDGRRRSPNNLAYIDATHLEAYSGEGWRPDGTAGLALTLMRGGYLALSLPEFTPERLERAGLLVSIAPGREFSRAERRAVREFVTNGGIFICTVGYDERGPSESLLSDFGFRVGGAPPGSKVSAREPEPLGWFKSPYFDVGDYQNYVRFHAAWPVGWRDEEGQQKAKVIAYGEEDLAVIVMRKVGRGKVVVIGDTGFAMNKNLENEEGEPFEGLRENAHFWRWFLSRLREQPEWVPPKPEVEVTPPADEAAVGAESSEVEQ